jgi:hypothetical protein
MEQRTEQGADGRRGDREPRENRGPRGNRTEVLEGTVKKCVCATTSGKLGCLF